VTQQSEHLWDFSLRTYAQPGVARSCLELQNRNGCDVNLLLFCCWGGLNLGSFPDDILSKAVIYSCRWRTEVVGPLRGARNWMKTERWITAAEDYAALRERIKSVELEAERLQQLALESLARDLPRSTLDASKALDQAVENLRGYLQRAGIMADRAALNNLAVLLSATVSDPDSQTIGRSLQRLGTV
jgi:uncharacterized protein (TIGR02444 family)